jgi:hypothetical protein
MECEAEDVGVTSGFFVEQMASVPDNGNQGEGIRIESEIEIGGGG